MRMKKLSLNGEWRLDIPNTEFQNVAARVPGSVYSDLLKAGLIPDPYWRDNETEALKLMEHDFIYRHSFDVSETLLGCDALLLRCEGLDTLATVELNGAVVGRADNMHRTWEWDVSPLLRAGRNEISVTFASPTRYIREQYAVNRADGTSDAMTGFPNLRKACPMPASGGTSPYWAWNRPGWARCGSDSGMRRAGCSWPWRPKSPKIARSFPSSSPRMGRRISFPARSKTHSYGGPTAWANSRSTPCG